MASDSESYGARLTRDVIRLGGPVQEQADFLQSLVTNDVEAAEPGHLVYAALLTPQGKYLSDFFILRDAEGYSLDVASSQGPALEKRLTMYRLRRPVTLARASVDVGVVWGGAAPENGLPDPRDPALGWRLYENVDAGLASTEAGDYDLHRLRLGIPESDADLVANDTYILEAGFERMSGVDFRKGCYVGQEIVARMKHKTELRKVYKVVSISRDVSLGEPVKNHENKACGTIYSNRDGIGIAHLRLDRVKSAESLHVDSANGPAVLSIE